MGDRSRGMYDKFLTPVRTDGKSAPGKKHHGCRYFLLDLDHDPLAREPLRVYAEKAREAGYGLLADDIENGLLEWPFGS